MIECVPCGRHAQKVLFKRKPDETTSIGSFGLRTCDDRYEIWSLGIVGEYRRKGYATQMLTEFIQQFQHDKPIVLYVYKINKVAIHLYEKVGFVIVGDCYFDQSAYKMQYGLDV